jgi:hypothetical protein
MALVLPVWFEPRFIPPLVLMGVVVLATVEGAASWQWVVAFFGLLTDVWSGTVLATYLLSYSVLYVALRLLYIKIIPSDRQLFSLPFVFIGSMLIIHAWAWVVGEVASLLGWHGVVVPFWHIWQAQLLRSVIGMVLIMGVYIIWQELLHRVSPPIRLKRLR